MEPRSLTLTLLLSIFFAHLLSAAALPSPSPSSLDSPASPPSHEPPATPRRAAPGFPPPKPSDFDEPAFQPPRRNVSRPHSRPSCPSGHRDCQNPKRSVARESPRKRGLNFAERLGLFFIGVAAALQVVLATFLVYKRIQLKKAERRIQREMASSSSGSSI